MDYYENQTYYDILGLPKDGKDEITGEPVSIESIQNARNRLIYGVQGQDSLPFWVKSKVEEAYSILSDSEKRREYDKSLIEKVDSDVSFNFEEEKEEKEQPEQIEEEKEEFEDIYSNSDHTIDSLDNTEETQSVAEGEEENKEELIDEQVSEEKDEEGQNEEPEKEEEEKQQEDQQRKFEDYPVFDIDRGFFDKKTNSVTQKIGNKVKSIVTSDNLRRGLVTFGTIGAGLMLANGFGLIAGIPVAIIANKIITKVKNSKLYRDNKEKKMLKLYTPESKLIEEYNKNLDDEIYALLSTSHENYNLEIAKLKYKNQIELLKKRIEVKQNENVKKGGITKFRIELASLNMQLKHAEKKLKNLENYIGNYHKETKLNKLNENLQSAFKDVEKARQNENVQIHKIKKLENYQRTAKAKRDKKANKMVLHKNGIARRQSFLVAYNIVKNKIKGYNPIETETLEESVKTR